MRNPTRLMVGNLRWTRTGTVWADWILSGIPYGLRPNKDKSLARELHQALLRALPGESLLLGVTAPIAVDQVMAAMTAGIDLSQHPDWLAECRATRAWLEQFRPGDRVYWLSVPLGKSKPSEWITQPGRAVMVDLRERLSLPWNGPTATEIAAKQEQAEQVVEALPHGFSPQPATPGHMVWLHDHLAKRGSRLQATAFPPAGNNSKPVVKSRSALADVLLDEGGQTDHDFKMVDRWSLLNRRFVKIQSEDAVGPDGASYQALGVLADVPEKGMVFPGSEFLGRVDECGVDVDWALRLNVRSSAEIAGQNRRALRNINEQFFQRDGIDQHGSSMMDRVAADLADYVATLEKDRLEVEVQGTVIFCASADTAEKAQRNFAAIQEYFGISGYKISQPLGMQEDLWWAMVPGAATMGTVRELAQIATSRAMAASVPLADASLGDEKGSLLAVNLAYGPLTGMGHNAHPVRLVLHDLEGASDKDISGSVAIAGELGSGKTLTLMKLAGDAIDRGGRVIAADRTEMGEWAQWAASVTKAVVVDVANPSLSLDPLRLFDKNVGARVTQSFLTPLLNIRPTSERGVILAEILSPEYLAHHQIDSLGMLIHHMETDCQILGARDIARLINVFAKKDFGRVLFDGAIPAVQLHDRAVIIRTHTLVLPSREELEHEHLFEQLSLEKIFGRAIYALIAGYARQLCFARRDELGLFVVDEAHSVTISPEGEREIANFVRDGRKHRAAVALGSHDPMADFGSDTLRGLIPTRILMRHRDKTLAQHGLRWLDLDENDEYLQELVRMYTSPVSAHGVPEHRRGECLIRDASGNVGRAKIMAPAVEQRGKAVRLAGSAGLRQKQSVATS